MEWNSGLRQIAHNWKCRCDVPLPVSAEIHAWLCLQRQPGQAVHLLAIRQAAVILAS